RPRRRSWAVCRVSGRAKRSEIVLMRSFSRCGQRWAATLMSAATAGLFVVFTTIDDHAVAVRVSGVSPDQRLAVMSSPENSSRSGQTGSTTGVLGWGAISGNIDWLFTLLPSEYVRQCFLNTRL